MEKITGEGIVKKRMGITSAVVQEIIATLVKNKRVNLMKVSGKKPISVKSSIDDIRVLAGGASADTVDKIIAYESGELEDDDVIALFADLIKSGMAWQLQGSYGRQAKQFIDAGIISRRGEILSNGEEARVKEVADAASLSVVRKLLQQHFGATKFIKVAPTLFVCAVIPKIIARTQVVKFFYDLQSVKDQTGLEWTTSMFIPKVMSPFDLVDDKATTQGYFYEIRDTSLNISITFDVMNRSISIFSGMDSGPKQALDK